MTPEQRLILCTILLAVSECDSRFVTWIKYGNTKEDTARIKELTRKEAHEFVESIEFVELCNRANVDATRMRTLDPEKAHKLFIHLVDPRKELT